MSPELPPHSEERVMPIQPESRFGDEDAIIETMRTHELKILGRIEDFVPNIAEHVNVVEIAEATHGDAEASDKTIAAKRAFANELDVVEVEGEGEQKFWCIFKPQDGENKEIRDEFGFNNFYSHEHSAYLISRHFNLGVVPPTTVREIDGRLGALQLFLPHEQYLTAYDVIDFLGSEDLDAIVESEDMMKMQVLDFLIGNTDRHQSNFFYRVEPTGDQTPKLYLDEHRQPQIVGVDHGTCLNDPYNRLPKAYEPYGYLTYSNADGKPLKTPVPENILGEIERGIDGIDSLISEVEDKYPDLSHDVLSGIKSRAEKLLKHRHFLSRRNIRLFEDSTGTI